MTLQDVSIHFRYAGSGPPLLLVHGNPQFSLTWREVGPLLAENFTVIAPDNRGAGDSSIPPDGNYSSSVSADDLKGVLDSLNITSAYVFSHDKGVGMATALAIKYPSLVKKLGVGEYAYPGYGYETAANPAPYWDLYGNPQLAFFQVPDLAEFLISGKEKLFLEWYFYHGSYSGASSIPEDIVNQYTSSIAKPGFLRAMLGPFSSQTVAADAAFFTSAFQKKKLSMPLLGLGGEASFGIPSVLKQIFSPASDNLEVDVVPKAGHWIGAYYMGLKPLSPLTHWAPVCIGETNCTLADENPKWLATRINKFFSEGSGRLPATDLSWFENKVTLSVGYFGTYHNFALASQE